MIISKFTLSQILSDKNQSFTNLVEFKLCQGSLDNSSPSYIGECPPGSASISPYPIGKAQTVHGIKSRMIEGDGNPCRGNLNHNTPFLENSPHLPRGILPRPPRILCSKIMEIKKGCPQGTAFFDLTRDFSWLILYRFYNRFKSGWMVHGQIGQHLALQIDILLFEFTGSRTLVLFYKNHSTSYSYTRLGKVDDTTDLASILGSGNATITFELK